MCAEWTLMLIPTGRRTNHGSGFRQLKFGWLDSQRNPVTNLPPVFSRLDNLYIEFQAQKERGSSYLTLAPPPDNQLIHKIGIRSTLDSTNYEWGPITLEHESAGFSFRVLLQTESVREEHVVYTVDPEMIIGPHEGDHEPDAKSER